MTSPILQLSAVKADETVIQLPHPYQTEYTIQKASAPSGFTVADETILYKLIPKTTAASKALPFELHNASLVFTEPIDLKSSELPPASNNGTWARARRSPCVNFFWDGEAPTLGQAWLAVYVLFTVKPGMESFRLELKGKDAATLAQQIKDVLLGIDHPLKAREKRQPSTKTDEGVALVLRSTFWQGAGSPFGPRPVWCPQDSPSSLPASNPLGSYPLTPYHNTMTISSAGDPRDPDRYQQSWHPIRPAKPAPGATIYSRWIPHLKETFSMVSLDYHNAEHLRLFHEWQNDPRVSQGWNETGTLDQHREYLRVIDEDPHQVAVLAYWQDVPFAYFEIYWAKVINPHSPPPIPNFY